MITWGMPMNPAAVLFAAAPGEAELELARPYQHAHKPTRSTPPDRTNGSYEWVWNRQGTHKIKVWIPSK